MSEMSYIDQAYYNLNTAYSIHFMILQNLDRILSNKGSIFDRKDIFGKKSELDYIYDSYYKDYADIRNEFFSKFFKFLNPESSLKNFKENANYLIQIYNELLSKDIKYSDVFSDRDIFNWNIFNEMIDNAENFQGKNIDILKLQSTFGQFLVLYEQYKQWLSVFEIYETLEKDITSYGSKSIYFGKPNNPGVFVINFDEFHNYTKSIHDFIAKFKKSIKNKTYSSFDEKVAETICLENMINFCNLIDSRFGHANMHIKELGSLFSRITYKLSHMSDGNFEVNEVYIHKNEILPLINALGFFPELHDLANQITNKFLGLNVEFSKNKPKENT